MCFEPGVVSFTYRNHGCVIMNESGIKVFFHWDNRIFPEVNRKDGFSLSEAFPQIGQTLFLEVKKRDNDDKYFATSWMSEFIFNLKMYRVMEIGVCCGKEDVQKQLWLGKSKDNHITRRLLNPDKWGESKNGYFIKRWLEELQEGVWKECFFSF